MGLPEEEKCWAFHRTVKYCFVHAVRVMWCDEKPGLATSEADERTKKEFGNGMRQNHAELVLSVHRQLGAARVPCPVSS
jgi:hypothetical protein